MTDSICFYFCLFCVYFYMKGHVSFSFGWNRDLKFFGRFISLFLSFSLFRSIYLFSFFPVFSIVFVGNPVLILFMLPHASLPPPPISPLKWLNTLLLIFDKCCYWFGADWMSGAFRQLRPPAILRPSLTSIAVFCWCYGDWISDIWRTWLIVFTWYCWRFLDWFCCCCCCWQSSCLGNSIKAMVSTCTG